MRDFFIRGFEVILGVVLVLGAIAVVIAAGAVAFGAGQFTGPSGAPMRGGPIVGLAILVGGLVYLLFVGGLMYLGLGIYHNTRRTADALEARGGRL